MLFVIFEWATGRRGNGKRLLGKGRRDEKKREGNCRREEMKEERVDEVGESRTGGNKSPCWSQ